MRHDLHHSGPVADTRKATPHSGTGRRSRFLRVGWRWLLPVLILCVAAAIRLWRLEDVPPGLTHDEAGHAHDAVAILNGARPIYEAVGYGREPLYDYVLAAAMALGGPTGWTLRLCSVILGLVTLAATFAWVRLAFDHPTALAALAFQAASFWSLATARQILRSTLLPALFTIAVLLCWRSIFGARKALVGGARSRPALWLLVVVALLLGATLYTYIPARVTWVVFPAFVAYLAVSDRALFRRVWLPVLAVVLVGLIIAAPLFAYLSAHPGVEQRLAMLDAPLRALRSGDVGAVLGNVWSGVASFLVPGHGDRFLAYTIPGRPVFDPLTGALFLAGLGLCLVRWRDPARGFALLWFLVGISPSLITGAMASTTRSIAALPVVFLFPALAAVAGARWVRTRWGAWLSGTTAAGVAVLIAATGCAAVRDYFIAWGASRDVRAAYQHTLVQTARYLDAEPEAGLVVLSTVYPQAPHDPYVFDASISRRDLVTRWIDGRRALLLPVAERVRLVSPASAPLDPYFAALPGFHPNRRILMRADDLDPYSAVYDWEPQVSLAALEARATGALPDMELPVDFGGVLQLVGYDLRTPAAAPGGTIELVTLWRVVGPQLIEGSHLADLSAEIVVFTHALNVAGEIVGQEDRLDAPAWDWQAGDTVAQIHRFSLPSSLPAGPLELEVGAYWRPSLTRLSVRLNGAVVGDRVLLQPVEVRAE